jgi:membrane fusion protein, multidrug efflux system
MARKRTYIILIILALLALIVGTRFVGRDTSRPATGAANGAPAASRATPVYAETIRPQLLREEVTATGVIRAAESVDLVSQITALVVSLHLPEGAPVAAGALLVKLDDAELQAELQRARQRVALAQAQAERERELLRAQGTSQQAYDEALSEQRVLEAEVKLIEAQLEKTEIRAPFAGVVGLRYVSVGTFVSPSTRIASLQRLDELQVDFSVAERHASHLTLGTPIQVQLVGRDAQVAGQVFAIEPRIDDSTRTVRLRARLADPGRAYPGAFATVRLVLREIPDALLVPASALVPGLNEQSVFVVQDGRAQQVTVQTGIRRARDVQIVSGLEPGAVVVTSGQFQLQPGAPVEPLERPAHRDRAAAE